MLNGEVTMRLQFREAHETELAAELASVQRVDGYTLEWTGATFMDACRLAQQVFNLSMQSRKLE